jgi:acetolactate synthase-1/2/3 large subunit
VHLSLPTDALESRTEATGDRLDFCPAAEPLRAEDAQRMLAVLRACHRPLILAGPACMTRPGRAQTAALQAASGIPVVGMESPRGTADPSLGAFAELLAQADAVLLLGKRLDFTLKFGQAPAWRADARLLQIDADPVEIERTHRAVGARLLHHARADAFSALAALGAAAKRPSAAHAAWQAEVEAALAYRPAAWADARAALPGQLHPVQALAPLQALLDAHPDAVLVSDGGEIGQWAQACLRAPHRLINGVAGSIGSGLPYALAARCALPDAPLVAVMGDGTYGFHIAEVDTAVRYGLPAVIVIGNDARWNAEYQIQLRDYGADRLIGCELRAARYDLVTAAFGGHGECVTDPAQMLPAAQRAQASRLPACVNVMIEGAPAPLINRPPSPSN